MKKVAIATLCMVAVATLVVAQAPAGMPPVPKPGPEHAILKQDEGAWDATVEMWMAPGAPPATSKGLETNTMSCGGLCLINDFKGEMGPGMAFSGHGVTTWDPSKKKYIGTWTDSMSTGISLTEGTFDATKKTMTGTMEGPDMTGKVVKMKSVTEWKDADTRVFNMYNLDPGGKEALGMRITYKRKK